MKVIHHRLEDLRTMSVDAVEVRNIAPLPSDPLEERAHILRDFTPLQPFQSRHVFPQNPEPRTQNPEPRTHQRKLMDGRKKSQTRIFHKRKNRETCDISRLRF